MTTDTTIQTDAAIPPGLFIADVLADMGLSQADLARRMGRPAQAINEIIAGRKALTVETAIELEQVLGIPAHIWSELEASYRLSLARTSEEREDITEDLEILDRIGFYAHLAKQGLVERTRNHREKVYQLRDFFGVTALANVEASYCPAFRLSESEREHTSTYALASWLRAAELQLEADPSITELPRFQPDALVESMPNLRSHTLIPLPISISQVRRKLRALGVVLVLQESIPGYGMCGAAFWWRRRVPVVIVSDHGKSEDRFWFNLLHELSHILLHGQRRVFIDLDSVSDRMATSAMEREADELACSSLISDAEYRSISWRSDYPTDSELRAIANRIGVHVGIVAGRLCAEGELPWSRLNRLSRKFRIADLG